VLLLCQKAGLVKLGHVALDGTKVKANASKHKAMSYERMGKADRDLSNQVAGWFKQASYEDRLEDRIPETPVPEWVKSRQGRLEKIREAKAALEEEERRRNGKDGPDGAGGADAGGPVTVAPKAQRNFTDPESRIMRKGSDFIQGYNAQIAVDARCGVIVANEVSNHSPDVHELPPMVDAIERECGELPRELSADAGYCSEANCQLLEDCGVVGYIATGRHRHGEGAPRIHRPPAPGSAVARMDLRLRRAGHRSRYRLRKQVVEPVFGQIKAARGFRQFLTRGLDNVREEWSLLCTAHNLLKLAKC